MATAHDSEGDLLSIGDKVHTPFGEDAVIRRVGRHRCLVQFPATPPGSMWMQHHLLTRTDTKIQTP